MTKTISQKLRELAYTKGGVPNLWWLPNFAREAIFDWKDRDKEYWIELTLDERCMFLLFLACALESEQ